jgi:hypothetical protein
MRLFEKLRALRLAKSDMGNAEKRPVGKNALELGRVLNCSGKRH